MVFHFKDKSSTVKHLSFILEAKSINTETLMLKETYGGGTIMQDLLFYDEPKKLTSDLKKLFKELKSYAEHMNNMQRAVGYQHEEDDGEEGLMEE
jgi:hypothetical protein